MVKELYFYDAVHFVMKKFKTGQMKQNRRSSCVAPLVMKEVYRMAVPHGYFYIADI